MEDLVHVYLDPKNPGGLEGDERFYDRVKDQILNNRNAEEILQGLDGYSVNKPKRNFFYRNGCCQETEPARQKSP